MKARMTLTIEINHEDLPAFFNILYLAKGVLQETYNDNRFEKAEILIQEILAETERRVNIKQ